VAPATTSPRAKTTPCEPITRPEFSRRARGPQRQPGWPRSARPHPAPAPAPAPSGPRRGAGRASHPVALDDRHQLAERQRHPRGPLRPGHPDPHGRIPRDAAVLDGEPSSPRKTRSASRFVRETLGRSGSREWPGCDPVGG
jgi:hypothetical protein